MLVEDVGLDDRNNHWVYQGRQYHQWFGHGTAPAEEKGAMSPPPGSPFDPFSVGKRIDYAVGSVVGQVSRGDRGRREARLSGAGRDDLKTAVAVWYSARGLSRDAFRARLLDPNTADATVDRLRSAARGIVDARTHEELGAVGESLTAAAQTVGIDRRPRFLGDAERRAVAAVSDGAVPGVMKASATSPDVAVTRAVLLGGIFLYLAATGVYETEADAARGSGIRAGHYR